MSANRLREYWLPGAWRGVASPSYAHRSRWHALVEELGGIRALNSGAPAPFYETLGSPVLETGSIDMSLLTEAAETEQLDELQRFVLEQLTRHERLVLLLFYADGLSLDEIAAVLELPGATVADLFGRTLETLRSHFG